MVLKMVKVYSYLGYGDGSFRLMNGFLSKFDLADSSWVTAEASKTFHDLFNFCIK